MNNISSFPEGSLAMASVNLIGPNRKMLWFAYRAERNNPQDSGWVLHGPNEDDDFSSNPNNFIIVQLEKMIEVDQSLAVLLEKPVWTCIERYADNGQWHEIHDFFNK